MEIERIFNKIGLNYKVKDNYLYVPLADYISYFPNEEKNWKKCMMVNTYVMLDLKKDSDIEKIIRIINIENKNSYKLTLKK